MSVDQMVAPSSSVHGTVRVPGDKSISHRAAMLAGLARGTSVIGGFLRCEDCLNVLRAVETLGAAVVDDGREIRVTGCGGQFLAPRGPLDMGNSGTGIRLLCGILAGHAFTAELTGDASLRTRPMARIRTPLEAMGARLELLGQGGCAPVRITGGRLKAIDYTLPVASAQVKAAVLLAGLFAEGVTRVTEPARTRDHSERMMRALGLPIAVDGLTVSITGAGRGRPALPAHAWQIPGDFSSAAFWIAAACAPGSEVAIENVGLNPRRTAFIDVLRRMGARIEVAADGGEDWEPVGTVKVTGAHLRGTTVAGAEIPNVIDELPLVAVVATLAEGETVIQDAGELRVKESDRIAATAAGLRRMGADVAERTDGMVIRGGCPVRGNVEVDSLGDHRIAMALSVLALRADGPVRVRDVACVDTSYPEFWQHLDQVSQGQR